MKDRGILLLMLGVIGYLPMLFPLFVVNGVCPVYGYNYCQGGVPVYINMFDGIRYSFLALLFISTVIIILSLFEIVRWAYLHPDIKILLVMSYSIATLSFSSNVSHIPVGMVALSVPLESSLLELKMNITKTVIADIYVYNHIFPLFILSMLVIGYYFGEVVFNVLSSKSLDA